MAQPAQNCGYVAPGWGPDGCCVQQPHSGSSAPQPGTKPLCTQKIMASFKLKGSAC